MGTTIVSGVGKMPPKKFVELYVIGRGSKTKRLIDMSIKSGVAYCAVRSTESNMTSCLVVLLKNCGDDWEFKVMSESEGPYCYECPAKVLQKLSATTCRVAIEWRNKCREVLEKRSKEALRKKPLRWGSVVMLDRPITFSDGVTESVFTCVTHYSGIRGRKLFLRQSDNVLCHISGLSDRSYRVG